MGLNHAAIHHAQELLGHWHRIVQQIGVLAGLHQALQLLAIQVEVAQIHAHARGLTHALQLAGQGIGIREAYQLCQSIHSLTSPIEGIVAHEVAHGEDASLAVRDVVEVGQRIRAGMWGRGLRPGKGQASAIFSRASASLGLW